jgi:microcompartment protein CcmK/EutM
VIRGRVLGEVWATRKAAGLAQRKLVLVQVTREDRVVVAVDSLAARQGQEVLVAFGSGARNVLLPGPDNRGLLCDAAVALLIDGGVDDAGEGP